MEIEQIIKRLDWLDDERRKDKIIIATLEERINNFQTNLPELLQQINEINSLLARVTSQLSRFDQIETTIAQMRVESARALDAAEKQRQEHDREMEKIRRNDVESLTKAIADVRKGLEPMADLKKGIQARMEEEFRLGRLIEEVRLKLDESRHSDEDYRRSLRLLEEGRRQDAKRLNDVQGEVAALRKRVDEQRGKVDLAADSVRKVELKISELQAAESERRQTQQAFIEKQTIGNVERERVWRDWQGRFEDITKQAGSLDAQLQALDATHRAVKRAQEGFDEITTRFERRINEITEMQRLVEERFRQEWVAFKADDQKRWANYTLAQEEVSREATRQFDKYNDRLVLLEDITQESRDLLYQVIEETQKRLQGMLALSHELNESYNRVFGKGR
jgi:chromosome segregation ATPase